MPPTSDVTIRAAREADIPEISVALARAFQDDPYCQWIFPEDEKRRFWLPKLFEAEIRHVILPLAGCDVAVSRGAAVGGGLWMPPGSKPSTLAQLRMARTIRRGAKGRIRMIANGVANVEKHRPSRPHWYLSSIGVDPLGRGQHAGIRLMEHRLGIADADGALCYLESSRMANIQFYERFGFEMREEIALPNGPAMWTMLRRPR